MIWRRKTSGNVVGSSPPPVRALYPDFVAAHNLMFIWCRSRAKTYNNGTLVIDSGWSAWTNSPIAPSSGFATSPSGGTQVTMVISIQTGGRWCPWLLDVEDNIKNLTTNVVTTSQYSQLMTPGDTFDFSYTASAGTSRTYSKSMISYPAEGY